MSISKKLKPDIKIMPDHAARYRPDIVASKFNNTDPQVEHPWCSDPYYDLLVSLPHIQEHGKCGEVFLFGNQHTVSIHDTTAKSYKRAVIDIQIYKASSAYAVQEINKSGPLDAAYWSKSGVGKGSFAVRTPATVHEHTSPALVISK